MLHNPLVSIVLPTHNGARYLNHAVRSCIEQTYANWELIIVDDASTDATPELIAGYAAEDSRIRSVRHEKNQKLPAALNTGFSQADGEYLAWTSDDNCYRPEALADMVAVLESDDDVDVVYGDHSEIDKSGRVLRRVVNGDAEQELLRGNTIGPCFLYRRSVYEGTGGYSEDLYLVEDYDYWLRVAARFRFRALHKDLYLYRLHAGSLTATAQRAIGVATERALLRNLPDLQWATASERGRAFLHLAGRAHARGDRLTAVKHGCHAMCLSPSLLITKVVPYLLIGCWRGALSSSSSQTQGDPSHEH